MIYRETDPDKLILRDHLAIDRTHLANERTLLAYLRTSIMLLISGITLIKLFGDIAMVVFLGICLIPIGLVLAVWGWKRFTKVRKNIEDARCKTS